MKGELSRYSINHPKSVVFITAIIVLLALSQYTKIKVDTDPENMLPENAPVRVFHSDTKKEFALYDLVVLGVVNDKNSDGVFNVDTLSKIYNITREIEQVDGVISREIIALSTKDNIEQGSIGEVKFNWLMEEPPETKPEALRIRDEAQDHPMFQGSVVSLNGKAVAIYIPIERKDISYEVAQSIREIIQKYPGEEEYHITGLPVANDQFGVEMFKQMAISAPLAGLVIFLLMWMFFKSAALIVAPMLVAISTVLITMGLLIGFGFPVHIMTSMIPIFLMPIAVLDSVHILSEFFDKYKVYNDRRKTMLFVIDELFSPMLFTSLTSAVGFFSLSFSPIPPVQVFGVFVAVGVMVAWLLTISFIPAYVMLVNNKIFNNFGLVKKDEGHLLDRVLCSFKNVVTRKYKWVLGVSVFAVILSVYGISRIEVNDNPVRWFNKNHSIRVADRILNKHFSGTYEAYLVMEAQDKRKEVFIEPEMLRYIEDLQIMLADTDLVGKTTSLADIVKKVYYELLGGDKVNNVVPNTRQAVAQSLMSFENSHKPDDLWHLVTPDYSKTVLWLQLKSGDNKFMSKVVEITEDYIKKNPPPSKVSFNWAGLTYINVVWQNNMVVGMLKNFLGSFVIVLFMMLFLFRSPVKALISMIPLTITILFIYSLLGFFGKDYDMPVAVLSALTLGLSVDFAIHFIQRAVEVNHVKGNWEQTAQEMFSGPGRAIIRNALVVAIGFLPLLAASLVPYKTVGFFMFFIMAVSAVATLFILPAIISIKPSSVLGESQNTVTCSCGKCMLIALFVAFAVAYVLFGYNVVGWKISTFIVVAIIVMFSGICYFASKRKICLTQGGDE
ncbi:MAG: MMPL family transporter [Candidatus Omnitrophica bacterium]|nr:MMPL family transporter [Candidatus Omnitrophota bacterium]